MGLGKTMEAMWFVRRNVTKGITIIVTEATIKSKWIDELQNHMGWEALAVQGKTPHLSKKELQGWRFIIVNYDILSKWATLLKSLNPTCVIFDESQNLTNRSSARTKAAKKLSSKAKYRLALSGTPIRNCPAELWPTLNILRPDLYRSFWSYADKFCDVKRGRFGWDVRGAQNLTELNRSLRRNLMVRRRKVDVLHELPPKEREVLVFDIEDPKYQEMQTEYRRWVRLSWEDENARSRSFVMKVMARQQKLLMRAAVAKVPFLVSWLRKWLAKNPGEKIVVFGRHKAVMKALTAAFKSNSVTIVGGTTQIKRMLHVRRFTKDPNCRILFGNIRAAGVGIDLVAASTCLFAELSWVPMEHSQAEDRIWRIGQEKPCKVYYAVSRGTVEEKLCKVNRDKLDVVSQIIDGGDYVTPIDTLQLLEEWDDERTIHGTLAGKKKQKGPGGRQANRLRHSPPSRPPRHSRQVQKALQA